MTDTIENYLTDELAGLFLPYSLNITTLATLIEQFQPQIRATCDYLEYQRENEKHWNEYWAEVDAYWADYCAEIEGEYERNF
jgi:hypothetical protein